jgi:O-antigen/teichoic acid export membrane protein
VGWGAISLGLGAVGAAIGYLAGLLASSVLIRSEQTPNRGTDLGSDEFRARQLLEYGVPLSLNSLMLQVVHLSDRFLIALLLGESAAGVYAAAYDLTQQTIALFLRATANASVPLIFKAALENEQKRLASYLRENLALLLTIGVAGIALFWEVVPVLVFRLIGASYRESLPLLMPIVAAATVAVGLRTHHFLLPLMIKEKTVLAVPASFVAMLTNVLANLWLIPRIGLLGAALATLMGYAVLLVITGLQTRRLMPTIQSSTDVVSIFAVGVLFAMVLRALPAENEWQSLRNGLLGGILYLTGLFALNVAGWRENLWRWIKTRH